MAKTDRIYELTSKNDFVEYLRLLIEHSYKAFDRYKEINEYIQKECIHILNSNGVDIAKLDVDDIIENPKKYMDIEIKVPFKKYHDIKAISEKDYLKLLNLCGDRTKEAVSYLKFRDCIKEFDRTLLDDLSQDINTTLNKLNAVRNTVHHIPDSTFISQVEYRKQQRDFFGSLAQANPSNIITVNKYNYVEFGWFLQMYVANCESINAFKKVIQQMKKDYSKLIGGHVRIERPRIEVLPLDYARIGMNGALLNIKGKKKFDIKENTQANVITIPKC